MKYFRLLILLIGFFSMFSVNAGENEKFLYGVSIENFSAYKMSLKLTDFDSIYFGINLTKTNFNLNDKPNSTSDTISYRIAYRRYLDDKSAISRFIQANLSSSIRYENGVNDDTEFYYVDIAPGLEYFITQSVSVEGMIGFGVQYRKISSGKFKTLIIPATRMGITYYF